MRVSSDGSPEYPPGTGMGKTKQDQGPEGAWTVDPQGEAGTSSSLQSHFTLPTAPRAGLTPHISKENTEMLRARYLANLKSHRGLQVQDSCSPLWPPLDGLGGAKEAGAKKLL